jgi:hypothetical protein
MPVLRSVDSQHDGFIGLERFPELSFELFGLVHHPPPLWPNQCRDDRRVFGANLSDECSGRSSAPPVSCPSNPDGKFGGHRQDDAPNTRSPLRLPGYRHECIVVGEDLGTVPEGFRERMARANILSYRVLFFERDEQGFVPAAGYPALALVSSHDLPTLCAWWDKKCTAPSSAAPRAGGRYSSASFQALFPRLSRFSAARPAGSSLRA